VIGNCATADASGDLSGILATVSDVAGKIQEVCLAASFGRRATGLASPAPRSSRPRAHEVHVEMVEHLHHLPGVIAAESPRWKSAELSLTATANPADTRPRRLHNLQQRRARFSSEPPTHPFFGGERRKELAEQIAMSGVDLHPVKSGLLGQLSVRRETRDDLSDENPRSSPPARRSGWTSCRGPSVRPRAPMSLAKIGLHLATRMVDLKPDLRASGSADLGPAPEPVQMPVSSSTTPPGPVIARPSTITLR